MSKLLLFGPTALDYYGHIAALPEKGGALKDANPLEMTPTRNSIEYLHQSFPFLDFPFHVSAPDIAHRRAKLARCHVAAPSVMARPPHRIANGILAPSPALALIEAARGRSILETALEGSKLCSRYFLDANCTLIERTPFANEVSLGREGKHHADVGGHQTFLKALPFVLENAASPREISLGLILSLPTRFGGYGLPKPVLNYPIQLPARLRALADRSLYVADCCWPRERVIVEYDSDRFHLSSESHHHDAVRRNALESFGWRVVSVTARQLTSPLSMSETATVIARALGRFLRTRAKRFDEKQAALWNLLLP